MKKIFALIAVIGMFSMGASFNGVIAQEDPSSPADTTAVDTTVVDEVVMEEVADAAVKGLTTTEGLNEIMMQMLLLR